MPVASSIEADAADGNLDQRNVRLISVGYTSQNPYRNPAVQIPYLHLDPQVTQLYWGVRLFQSTKGHVHLSGTVGWIFLSKYNLILDYIKDHLSLGHSLPNVGVFSRCGLFPAYE